MSRLVMHTWLCYVLIVTLCLNIATAAAPKKKETTLDSKVSQLMDMAARKSVLRFDNGKFNTYVKSAPRNYSFIVQFTALASQRQCTICREANSEYEIVADSWKASNEFSNKLFFATVDYDDGPDVFSSLGLNTAPFFIHFPQKGKHKNSDKLDINRLGFSAETLAKFVTDKTSIHIHIQRPPNYSNIVLGLLTIAIIGGLLYRKRNNLEFFQNKSAWAVGVLATIFTMTSGQMWNHIRGAQMVSKNQQNGQVEYIHPWSDSQLIAETYIVFALNAVVVMGMIILNDASTIKMAVGKKRVLALCGIGSVIFFFSLLLSVFKSKYHGYPYSLLFS